MRLRSVTNLGDVQGSGGEGKGGKASIEIHGSKRFFLKSCRKKASQKTLVKNGGGRKKRREKSQTRSGASVSGGR